MAMANDSRIKAYRGMKVLVMGLGLHGGGLESVRYLVRAGADVTVTDLRDETVLAPSLEKMRESGDQGIRYVLGRHNEEDFKQADLVIKNPGVPSNSPYLAISRRIETDISLFLAENPARLIAVTGSKGKSSAAAAAHWVLARAREAGLLPGAARLGGNITVSPLSFLDGLSAGDDVILELSSWQLGDLRGRRRLDDAGAADEALLKPRGAILTAIMQDHQDRYASMADYVDDKRIIYQGQDRRDLTVAQDDSWGRSFLAETGGRPLAYAGVPAAPGYAPGCAQGWLEPGGGPCLVRLPGGEIVEAVPASLRVPGAHSKMNLLAAALALLDLGLPPAFVRESLGAFPGIEHRLEFFHEAGGIRFYNDTAATIPEAAAAAVAAFDVPVVLVTGGADKKLDYGPLVEAAKQAKSLTLLAGTGSAKLAPLLAHAGLRCRGPFDTLDAAVRAALDAAAPGDAVVLSPGSASFSMFVNEFDRGRKWKEAVRRITGQ
ncbi:MAG: UDP-N-acetylmuramoyl-L-alanine--D-glutamate ligase [Spirochaetaceae bacterium]|nr:UDP-N-acetylmuramoyl-L-alanine--D-glutamate ligase [Spirochaetaceae bacterium]